MRVSLKLRVLLGSAALLALLLVGCGGSGGGTSDNGPEIPVEQRFAALEAIESFTESLTYENFDTQADSVIDYLKSLPEILDAKRVEGEKNSIQAEFTDGRILLIYRNRNESEAPSSPDITREPGYSLPGSTKAAAYWCFGSDIYFGNSATRVSNALRSAGYDSTSDPTSYGTLGDISHLGDVGVLIMETHGSVFVTRDNKPFVAIQTYTIASSDFDEIYKDDLDDKSLVYSMGNRQAGEYCFTQKYVQKHIQLNGTIVFMNACSSFKYDVLADAFLAKGAGAYFGWSQPVEDSDAVETSLSLFDLLLGKNTLLPNSAPNFKPAPPMTWQEAFDKLSQTTRREKPTKVTESQFQDGSPFDPANLSFLKVKGTNNGTGTILPSITSASESSGNSLFVLGGRFGYLPGTIIGNPGSGDIPLPFQSWGPSGISVDYNPAVTSLQVSVGSRKSNIFTLAGSYTVSGIADGIFESKESIRFWVNDNLVYSGSGLTQTPFSFSANPGAILKYEVKTDQNYGGPGNLYIKTPSGFQYKFVNKTFDYIPNATTRICYTGSIILQP